MRKVSKQEYIDSFINSSALPTKSEKIHEKAYEIANDNRKFEIENYWKRTNYYWLFQASVYGGYFYSITKTEITSGNPEIIFVMTCLGFLTALAWFLTNLGSKHWLHNWENHVFELEDEITGPLNKISGNIQTWSVTKINMLVSLFSSLAWFFLGLKTIHNLFNFSLAFAMYFFIIASIIIIFYFCGRTMFKRKEIHWYMGQEESAQMNTKS